MRPVDQTIFSNTEEGTHGNCMQAAVASILGLRLSAVPNFIAGNESSSLASFRRLREFISQFDLVLVQFAGRWSWDLHYLAVGPAARGVNHMVVMFGGELAHDPHPSRTGLLEVEICYLLVPRSVSGWIGPPGRSVAAPSA